MYTHILLPTDGSELSAAAVQNGIRFAKGLGAKVTGICVIPSQYLSTSEGLSREAYLELPAKRLKAAKEFAAVSLATVEKAAKEAGVDCEVVVEMSDQPYEAIIQTAERKGCDLIMMASHGRRGVKALLIGSETQKVLTHSKIPVLVYR
jgi:nucleotide-binding universal stress UspA family protein